MSNNLSPRAWLCICLLSLPLGGCRNHGSPTPAAGEYLAFVKSRAADLRSADQAPASLEEWTRQTAELKQHLAQAWGSFPTSNVPLQPQILGRIQRDGYQVERVIFQTLPGVYMTANAYVPAKPGPSPALLAVHGHWQGAKSNPEVQSRCIGAVKLGYFVLAVDALGAGERGLASGEEDRHGDLTGATLYPVGLTLAGLQVYENMRAVDYLISRPEVRADRIGVTGASGGGNQTMYAAAWDKRFAFAAPVCSVGNYQAYLGVACCLCEVIPGALHFTEEGNVLGLAAPRTLLVMNALRDAPQFSVAEARKSFTRASSIFGLYQQSPRLTLAVFDAKHSYSRPMRESLYGWLSYFAGFSQSTAPIAESATRTEPPESLKCFPGTSRPKDWVTIPRYANRTAQELLRTKSWPTTEQDWQSQREPLVQKLRTVLNLQPLTTPLGSPATRLAEQTGEPTARFSFTPEPGIQLNALYRHGDGDGRTAIVLSLEGAADAEASPLAKQLHRVGWNVVTLDLRSTGNYRWPRDKVDRAPDLASAEWGLWIGRPLLGQWTQDVLALMDALAIMENRPIHNIGLVGLGPAGLVACTVAAVDPRVGVVLTEGTLATYVTEVPYENQRLGTIVPGFIPQVGDIPHLLALIAPRPLLVTKPVRGNGNPIPARDLSLAFEPSQRIWNLLNKGASFRVVTNSTVEEELGFLRSAMP